MGVYYCNGSSRSWIERLEMDCSGSGYRQVAGFRFHEMWGISTITEDVIASKEGLRSKGLVCTGYYLRIRSLLLANLLS